MLSKRTIARLHEVIEDARRIETFIDGMNLSDFLASERTLFAVERLLQRITEAAVQIDPDDMPTISQHLPVAKMRALGNRLRHEYREIDRGVIFDIARIEVPAVAVEAELILDSFTH